ncbi:MAG: hypothetical protein U5L96_13875 [Owenweeksia sp.]|nr:hypothetical protein [Owenweeksia sp.]
MYIYDISQPPAITQLGMYEHIVSCDPVVANDRYAFVTLRSSMNNDACNRSVNQLDVIDIRNLTQPELVESYAMKHPIGLGLYGDTLLVCDDGLKVMDATDVLNLNLIHHNTSLPAVDIIPFGNLMIIATETGFAQYRYKNGQLKFLSSL